MASQITSNLIVCPTVYSGWNKESITGSFARGIFGWPLDFLSRASNGESTSMSRCHHGPTMAWLTSQSISSLTCDLQLTAPLLPVTHGWQITSSNHGCCWHSMSFSHDKEYYRGLVTKLSMQHRIIIFPIVRGPFHLTIFPSWFKFDGKFIKLLFHFWPINL